jgi:NlpC/P60 family putative phage cell wall peptidase
MSVITGDLIVREARSWLGTPFHHQGRLKGIGVDCIGLVVGIARDLNLTDRHGKHYFDRQDYGREPYRGQLQEELEDHLLAVKASQAQAGDVLLLKFAVEPQHVGILTAQSTLIHAYSRYSRLNQCVEHRLAQIWQGRIAGAYRYPGVKH